MTSGDSQYAFYGMTTSDWGDAGSWKIMYAPNDKVTWFGDEPPHINTRNALYPASQFMLIGDSARLAMSPKFQSSIVQARGNSESASTRLFHLRHSNRANVLFADGHILACDRNDLKNNGITGFKQQNGANQDGTFY